MYLLIFLLYFQQPSANKAGESDGSDSGEEDIEEAMKKEVDAMKEKKPAERRFQNTNTKSRNTIFIKTTLEDPSTLAHTILTDIYNTGIQKSRFAIRMLPISNSCKCRLEDIEILGKKLFKKYFETPFGTGLSYTTVFTKRNNTEISRETVIPKLGQIIKELNPLHRVNHVTPDYVILVEIIGKICCISVVQDFFKFKKYNLIEVSKLKNANEEEKQNKNENKGKEKEAGSKNEKEDGLNGDDDEDDDEAEDKSESQTERSESQIEKCESQIQNKSEDDEKESGCDDTVNGNRKRKREFSCETEEVLLKEDGKKGSISRETTVIMEKVPRIEAMNQMVRNQTVAMESLDRSETVVMESLPRTETVVMKSLDQEESVMDALSKGESIMDMGTVSGESTMEVLTKEESVMDSF